MGLFSKKTKMEIIPEFPGAWRAKGRLASAAEPGAIERVQRAGEPYEGQLTAPLSPYEQKGMESLEDYLESPSATERPLYQAGAGEIEKTLAGDYDPVGSTYYQAYRNAVMRELREAKDRLAAETSARDKYFGGGRIETAGELEEEAVGDLAMMLGQLFERERERRLGAAPLAIETALGEAREPAERAQVAQQLGALPREIEDIGLQREYQEYIRQMQDLGVPLETILALMMNKPQVVAQQEGGGLGSLLGALAMGAGAAGGIPNLGAIKGWLGPGGSVPLYP